MVTLLSFCLPPSSLSALQAKLDAHQVDHWFSLACSSRKHRRGQHFPGNCLHHYLLQEKTTPLPQVQANVPFSRLLQTCDLLGTLETVLRLGGWRGNSCRQGMVNRARENCQSYKSFGWNLLFPELQPQLYYWLVCPSRKSNQWLSPKGKYILSSARAWWNNSSEC